MHYTEVQFTNYKAFKSFRVRLNDFNVLVGPNNAGKSTVLGAFRILSEGVRKASSKSAEFINGPSGSTYGYKINLEGLPVSTENVFHNYNDDEFALVEFKLSNGNKLTLYFPAQGVCYLIPSANGKVTRTPSKFKQNFRASISTVPVLGPVEHNELLRKKETARLALLSHTASRNFRNIWHHFPEHFDKFKELIQSTWPGMDILKPELDHSAEKSRIHMFCPEERYPREIYWAGFGFQVWCQMLTFLIQSEDNALLIIDEPDIYLHADLQRQLVGILKELGPDILIATHSTEIISEVSADCLLSIDKKRKSSKRINNVSLLSSVFELLGSNLNPVLTQLAKTKRIVLVEGKDFKIISKFARILKKNEVANRSNFAVIPVEGFNPERAKNFVEGVSATLGTSVKTGVIFDRDFRSSQEVSEICKKLNQFADFSVIHQRKEIENYLLNPAVIDRAIKKRIEEIKNRTGDEKKFDEDIEDICIEITDSMKNYLMGQYMTRREEFEKATRRSEDPAVFKQEIICEFDEAWKQLGDRLKLVPGKQFLTSLNEYLEKSIGINITMSGILECFRKEDIPDEMVEIVEKLERL